MAAAVNCGPPSEDSSSAMPNVAITRRRAGDEALCSITGLFHHGPITVFVFNKEVVCDFVTE